MSTITIDARKITHSGIGRYLRNLLPGVLPLLDADRILLLGREADVLPFARQADRCSIVATDAAPHSLAEQRLALHSALRSTDLLWVPHYNIPLLYRGALVTTLHDLAPLDLVETFDRAFKRRLAGHLLRQCARRARAILTPSAFSCQRIVDALAVDPERVHVTPLGVDTAWPALGDAPAPYASDKPYLLFVGNLKPNKNLPGLLRAMELLSAHSFPRLLIAGKLDGFRTGDGAAATAAAAFGDRVRFLGAVSDLELIALYRGASALAMPSLYEGFGLPVLEAMRYGCPVVTSAGTALQEVAGQAAILVDPRDPVSIAEGIQQTSDPERREHLRLAGFAREAGFSYRDAISQTGELLNSILDG